MNRVVNPVVRIVLRSPLHGLLSRGVLLITVSGRRSGRRYTLPVQYARREEELYVLPAMAERKTWWRNLEGGAPVTLRIRGTTYAGEAEALTGAAAEAARAAFADTTLERAARGADAGVVIRVRKLRLGAEVDHAARQGVKATGSATLRRLGGSQIGVWAIKHLVAPLDRWLARCTGGRVTATGRFLGPVLLLTTTGRRTGQARTTPVFYLRDGERLIVCNVNPGFERPNPWTLNLRATPVARVQIGRDVGTYRAREATAAEIGRYWPRLTRRWPAYQTHFARSGERSVFVLERAPDGGTEDRPAHDRGAGGEPYGRDEG